MLRLTSWPRRYTGYSPVDGSQVGPRGPCASLRGLGFGVWCYWYTVHPGAPLFWLHWGNGPCYPPPPFPGSVGWGLLQNLWFAPCPSILRATPGSYLDAVHPFVSCPACRTSSLGSATTRMSAPRGSPLCHYVRMGAHAVFCVCASPQGSP